MRFYSKSAGTHHLTSRRLLLAGSRQRLKLSVGTGLDVPVSGRAGRPFLGGRSSSDLTPPLTAQQARRETWRRRRPEARLASEQGGSSRQHL